MRNREQFAMGIVLSILVPVLVIGCSSVEQKGRSGSGDAVLHRLSRIVLRNLHVRRPSGPGADPKAMPGGPDYKSSPLPDARLDCKPIRDLFASFRFAQVRECFQKLSAGTQLSFRVRYRAEPLLEFDGARNDSGEPIENLAPCVRDTLGKIPVPREIFFQSTDEGSLECYSSRLPVESEKLLGAPWPLSRTHLTVAFPLPVMPKDDTQTSLLLQTWALTPFFGAESGQVAARIVPDALCKACIGEDHLYAHDRPNPPHWPEGGPDFNSDVPPPPPPPLTSAPTEPDKEPLENLAPPPL